MDVETALRKVKRQFGDEYDVTIVDEDIYYWIHEAELDIIRQTASNDTVLNIPVSAFPAILPTKVSVKRVSINNKALTYTTRNQLDLASAALTSDGTPTWWYFESHTIFLFPVGSPSDAFTVDVVYCRVPDEITEATVTKVFTVPEVYHEDVVKFCIARAHNKNMNWKAAESEMELYDRNVSTRRNEAQAIEAPLYKGVDPMDYDFAAESY